MEASKSLNNYIVTIGDKEANGKNTPCPSGGIYIKGKYRIVFECPSVSGQYVHIKLDGNTKLHICEVEVHIPKSKYVLKSL